MHIVHIACRMQTVVTRLNARWTCGSQPEQIYKLPVQYLHVVHVSCEGHGRLAPHPCGATQQGRPSWLAQDPVQLCKSLQLLYHGAQKVVMTLPWWCSRNRHECFAHPFGGMIEWCLCTCAGCCNQASYCLKASFCFRNRYVACHKLEGLTTSTWQQSMLEVEGSGQLLSLFSCLVWLLRGRA